MFAQVDSVEAMMKYLNNGLAVVLLVFGCIAMVLALRWIGTNIAIPLRDKIIKTLENTDSHLEKASKTMDDACNTMDRICEESKATRIDVQEIKPLIHQIHDRTKPKGHVD